MLAASSTTADLRAQVEGFLASLAEQVANDEYGRATAAVPPPRTND